MIAPSQAAPLRNGISKEPTLDNGGVVHFLPHWMQERTGAIALRVAVLNALWLLTWDEPAASA